MRSTGVVEQWSDASNPNPPVLPYSNTPFILLFPYERVIDHILDCQFFLESACLKFLFDDGGNNLLGDLAVERERISVFVISGGSVSGIHLDVFPQNPHRIVLVLTGISHPSLVGTEKFCDLLLFLAEKRFFRRESFVGPVGEDFLEVEQFVVALALGNLGYRKPNYRCIHTFGGQGGKARRGAADLKDGDLLRIDVEMAQ